MSDKDKIHRITLVLTDEQYNFVKASADYYGISISLIIRLVIVSTMNKFHGDIIK